MSEENDDNDALENSHNTKEVAAPALCVTSLPPENDDEGNQEYKWFLPANPSEDKFNRLVSQLLWRMDEGRGEAIYELGVHDDGSAVGTSEQILNASLTTLDKMAAEIEAVSTVLLRFEGTKNDSWCAKVLVRRAPTTIGRYLDLRVAIIGNVDAGKSTLIGCLTRAVQDDGRGLARSAIFNHPHEISTGRTSSVAHHLLCYDVAGNRINTPGNGSLWSQMVPHASKVITMYDLAGHERYLKTTVRGMNGQIPDYALLLVAANKGVEGMTKEHLKLCLALKVPIIAIVTKIDIAPKHVLKQTVAQLKTLLKARGVNRLTMTIKNEEDLLIAAKLVRERKTRAVPLFQISSVTGQSLDLLQKFLNLLPPRVDWTDVADDPAEMQIDSTYTVNGVGTVVGGMVIAGEIRENHKNLLLGPMSTGEFVPVKVRSIHCKRMPVRTLPAGHSAGFALPGTKRNRIRRGMVLIDASANPVACWEFEAEIAVLYHSTTIQLGYKPVVQILNCRQCASLIALSETKPADEPDNGERVALSCIRTGSRALCRFRFLYRPERLHAGTRLLITEGKTMAMGFLYAVYAGKPPAARRRGDRRRNRVTDDK